MASNVSVYEINFGNQDSKPFPRFITSSAAVCAIIFSVIGVIGKLLLLFLND